MSNPVSCATHHPSHGVFCYGGGLSQLVYLNPFNTTWSYLGSPISPPAPGQGAVSLYNADSIVVVRGTTSPQSCSSTPFLTYYQIPPSTGMPPILPPNSTIVTPFSPNSPWLSSPPPGGFPIITPTYPAIPTNQIPEPTPTVGRFLPPSGPDGTSGAGNDDGSGQGGRLSKGAIAGIVLGCIAAALLLALLALFCCGCCKGRKKDAVAAAAAGGAGTAGARAQGPSPRGMEDGWLSSTAPPASGSTREGYAGSAVPLMAAAGAGAAAGPASVPSKRKGWNFAKGAGSGSTPRDLAGTEMGSVPPLSTGKSAIPIAGAAVAGAAIAGAGATAAAAGKQKKSKGWGLNKGGSSPRDLSSGEMGSVPPPTATSVPGSNTSKGLEGALPVIGAAVAGAAVAGASAVAASKEPKKKKSWTFGKNGSLPRELNSVEMGSVPPPDASAARTIPTAGSSPLINAAEVAPATPPKEVGAIRPGSVPIDASSTPRELNSILPAAGASLAGAAAVGAIAATGGNRGKNLKATAESITSTPSTPIDPTPGAIPPVGTPYSSFPSTPTMQGQRGMEGSVPDLTPVPATGLEISSTPSTTASPQPPGSSTPTGFNSALPIAGATLAGAAVIGTAAAAARKGKEPATSPSPTPNISASIPPSSSTPRELDSTDPSSPPIPAAAEPTSIAKGKGKETMTIDSTLPKTMTFHESTPMTPDLTSPLSPSDTENIPVSPSTTIVPTPTVREFPSADRNFGTKVLAGTAAAAVAAGAVTMAPVPKGKKKTKSLMGAIERSSMDQERTISGSLERPKANVIPEVSGVTGVRGSELEPVQTETKNSEFFSGSASPPTLGTFEPSSAEPRELSSTEPITSTTTFSSNRPVTTTTTTTYTSSIPPTTTTTTASSTFTAGQTKPPVLSSTNRSPSLSLSEDPRRLSQGGPTPWPLPDKSLHPASTEFVVKGDGTWGPADHPSNTPARTTYTSSGSPSDYVIKGDGTWASANAKRTFPTSIYEAPVVSGAVLYGLKPVPKKETKPETKTETWSTSREIPSSSTDTPNEFLISTSSQPASPYFPLSRPEYGESIALPRLSSRPSSPTLSRSESPRLTSSPGVDRGFPTIPMIPEEKEVLEYDDIEEEVKDEAGGSTKIVKRKVKRSMMVAAAAAEEQVTVEEFKGVRRKLSRKLSRRLAKNEVVEEEANPFGSVYSLSSLDLGTFVETCKTVSPGFDIRAFLKTIMDEKETGTSEITIQRAFQSAGLDIAPADSGRLIQIFFGDYSETVITQWIRFFRQMNGPEAIMDQSMKKSEGSERTLESSILHDHQKKLLMRHFLDVTEIRGGRFDLKQFVYECTVKNYAFDLQKFFEAWSSSLVADRDAFAAGLKASGIEIDSKSDAEHFYAVLFGDSSIQTLSKFHLLLRTIGSSYASKTLLQTIDQRQEAETSARIFLTEISTYTATCSSSKNATIRFALRAFLQRCRYLEHGWRSDVDFDLQEFLEKLGGMNGSVSFVKLVAVFKSCGINTTSTEYKNLIAELGSGYYDISLELFRKLSVFSRGCPKEWLMWISKILLDDVEMNRANFKELVESIRSLSSKADFRYSEFIERCEAVNARWQANVFSIHLFLESLLQFKGDVTFAAISQAFNDAGLRAPTKEYRDLLVTLVCDSRFSIASVQQWVDFVHLWGIEWFLTSAETFFQSSDPTSNTDSTKSAFIQGESVERSFSSVSTITDSMESPKPKRKSWITQLSEKVQEGAEVVGDRAKQAGGFIARRVSINRNDSKK
ncbi:hypothetical protein HDU97_004578 [Phlyctochytrium planicorne]|nr:hypothetical protein HDU97_004578 [Phlyctochytrium planicorne]